MVGKVDLVMWTKNGAATLPDVLRRIDEIIPHESVCHKILVDDHSIDSSVEIAQEFNWTVYPNPAGGVASGANEALRHVDSDFFVSVEQDVLLSGKWWDKIPKHMENPLVGCAQGTRILTHPILRLLDEWQFETSGRRPPTFSIDNNIFRTKVVRSIGGFPNVCPICTDIATMKKMTLETPYRWIIDDHVVSLHVRDDLKASLEHTYKMGYLCARTPYCIWNENPKLTVVLRILLTSPIRALQIAIRRKCPNMVWAYPLLRLYQLNVHLIWGRGTVKSRNPKSIFNQN
jgi:glycosyltransferase involved in cell wall biosynthesis